MRPGASYHFLVPRVSKGSILIVAAAVLIGGCAGRAASLRDENLQLTRRLASMRAEGRRDRNQIRDLENQVLLLRDKLETAEVVRDRGDGRPTLPVQVMAPPSVSDGGEPDVLGAGGNVAGERFRVVGVDQDGVEIVYAGEAALDRSVRPAIRMSDDDGALAADDYSVPDAAADDARPPRPSARPTPRPQRARERIPVTSSVPPIDGAAEPAGEGDTGGTDPVAQYQRYVSALRAGNHAYAITGLRNFLEQHPAHDYADNAQYWLGEAYYDQKDYKRALAEFRLTVEKYPDGNKVPDALLKAGFCYLALSEVGSARTVLAQVIAIYPRSGPAGLATARLAELDAATATTPPR